MCQISLCLYCIIKARYFNAFCLKSKKNVGSGLARIRRFILIHMPARRPAQIVMKTEAAKFPVFWYNVFERGTLQSTVGGVARNSYAASPVLPCFHPFLPSGNLCELLRNCNLFAPVLPDHANPLHSRSSFFVSSQSNSTVYEFASLRFRYRVVLQVFRCQLTIYADATCSLQNILYHMFSNL